MTGAGAAIIALAVTVVTAGAGAEAALGLNGAAAAAADAAFASLASQASVSLINNKGDVGKPLKELGRSRTVKNLVVAAATAGVSNKLGASSLATWSETPWVNNLNVNLANAGSATLINTAVNGGSLKDNLEANILAALVNTAHGEAASKIKEINGDSWQQYTAHKIAHAVAGCAAAAANKGKCQDGAIGAAVGEIVAETFPAPADGVDYTPEERQKYLALAKLTAGTVVALSGGDVNTATAAADIAVKENFLRALTSATKVLYKVFKTAADIKQKTGKIDFQNFQKIVKDSGSNELIGMAGDLYTVFSKNSTPTDRLTAAIDLLTGLETNSKGNKYVSAEAKKYLQDKTTLLQHKAKMQNNFKGGRVFESQAARAYSAKFNLNPDQLSKRAITVNIDGRKQVTIVPDITIKGKSASFVEFKDVKHISTTDQFRAYARLNAPVYLVVSPKTQSISKAVVDYIKQTKGDIHVFDPKTNTFKVWR